MAKKKKEKKSGKQKEQNVKDNQEKRAEAPVVKNDQAEKEKETAIMKESVSSKSVKTKNVVRTTATTTPAAKRQQSQTRNSNGTITVKIPKINLGPKGSGKTSGLLSLKDEIK